MMKAMVLVVLCPFFHLLLVLLTHKALAAPVVLIPGLGASALETKFDKPRRPHWWCSKSTNGKWQRLWLKPTDLLPKQIQCWSDTIRQRYDPQSDTISNAPGVQIRVVQGKEGLEIVEKKKSSNAYLELLEFLEQQGHLVLPTPYDFRLSPRGNPQFLKDVKSTIEDAVQLSSQKATIISHSLGALFAHYFLTNIVDDEWIDNHILAWIPISPAYGGAVVDLLQLVSGDSEGISLLKPTDVREEQRSYETNHWLLPNPHLWTINQVLVQTPTRNYTAHDYIDIFRDANHENGPALYDRTRDLTSWTNSEELVDPGVSVYPIYGTGVETVETFLYSSNDLAQQPASVVTSLDGDGTVNLRSLKLGDRWNKSCTLVLDGGTHNGILGDKRLLDTVKQIVEGTVHEQKEATKSRTLES